MPISQTQPVRARRLAAIVWALPFAAACSAPRPAHEAIQAPLLELPSPAGPALVSWLEQTPGGAEVRVRHVEPDGTRGPSVRVAEVTATRASGYPRLARAGDTLMFAWTDAGDGTRVRAARARLEGTP